jgi:glycosyltransferase involved in cell wall biosynthesis
MTTSAEGDLRKRILALEDDNARLRTALAEAEARAAGAGHLFLIGDALPFREEPLTCAHAVMPRHVSVIIPAFNAGPFLERAVRSVWEQRVERDRVEILVVDDGSHDGTRALAMRLAGESPMTMRVLTHDAGRNRGVACSRQLAVQHAAGEFVALLDADDVFLPERLQASLDTFAMHDDLVAVCSLGRNVDAGGATVVGHNGTTRAGEWRISEGIVPPFTFEQLWRVDPIANSSLTIRRSALEAVGGFPTLMAHQAEDWLLALKLSLLAPIACLDRELILYTHHPGAYTNAYHDSGWREGARLETFYHLAWWMLRTPAYAEAGARFFRREYPRQIADHQRLLPLLRDYYAEGGRPAEGAARLQDHLERLAAELETLRRTVRLKLQENKRLRRLVSEVVAANSGQDRRPGERAAETPAPAAGAGR